jgi:Tfp pilus assembly protein PilE
VKPPVVLVIAIALIADAGYRRYVRRRVREWVG